MFIGSGIFLFTEVKIFEQRYIELNRTRITKAREAMSESGKSLFDMVPVLLNYNHPLIPCYVDGNVPHGIYSFEENENQKCFLDNLCSASGKFDGFTAKDESILALFCMGSTSSIGQGPRSDIDYWVCISHYMGLERISLLEKKCTYITKMAMSRGVEINFFIVKDNKFKEENSDVTDEDSCGSAQHMFLLDEFYRSSIYIAGKKLLWMIVPCEEELNYKEYTKQLFVQNIVDKNDWIDFGSVGKIPSDEYFGSALWLLYKGIDSPFKAVLKIMLMEAYSAEYPKTILLSMQMKHWMQSHDGYSLNLDSYYMVYEKITKYLNNRNDTNRMDLIRWCFYQKLSDGIKRITEPSAASYRRGVIRSLVESWGWGESELQFIDNQQRWRIVEVIKVYNRLFTALMQSYSALLSFGTKNNVSDSIKSVDISILSRKLFAAFDSYPGKIKVYNLNIGTNIAESQLSFVEVKSSSLFRDGWYLYTSSLAPDEIIGKKPVGYYSDIESLIVMAYFNGVLTVNSSIYIHSSNKDINKEKVGSLVKDLKEIFINRKEKVLNDDLLRPAKARIVGIFVNFSNDPTSSSDYHHIGGSAKNVNIFTCGQKNISMVGSILLVTINSWNEIVCSCYDGQMAIFNFIHDLSHYIHRGDSELINWHLYNYSQHMRAYISSQMSDIFAKCLQGMSAKEPSSFELIINNENYTIAFDERFFDITLNVDDESKYPLADFYSEEQLSVPSVIDANATYGCMQFFFASRKDGLYDIYEVDEMKTIRSYKGFQGSISELIHSITLYYSKKLDISGNKKVRYKQYFNLPQFYEVDSSSNSISPLMN